MNCGDDVKILAGHNTGTSRIPVLKALYECEELSLTELTQCTIHGFKCTYSNGSKSLLQVLLTSYVVDISECEDTVFVKRSSKTSTLCYTYVVVEDKFKSNKNRKPKNLGRNPDLLRRLMNGLSQSERRLQKFSKLPILPGLTSFPFMSVYGSVLIYSQFVGLNCCMDFLLA